jgi:hypothetical protein
MFFSNETNDVIADSSAKIRSTVNDPVVAEKLILGLIHFADVFGVDGSDLVTRLRAEIEGMLAS